VDSEKKCPGVDFRNLTSEEIECPNCGYKNEIFKDENLVKCEKCEMKVRRVGEKFAFCLSWCENAEECVGKIAYQKWLEQKDREEK